LHGWLSFITTEGKNPENIAALLVQLHKKKIPQSCLLLDWNLQRKHTQEIALEEEDRGLFFI
jgi:hypothetical protein